VKLFDPKKEPPVRLNIGDQVQFYAVSKEEFETLSG
jgi:allophanate hydrolase subunit 1